MSKKRFYELDALRGIAALVVVLFHYSSRYQEIFGHEKSGYLTTFGWGHYGVQLFFIISGFVIYMTVLKVKSVKDFTIKRIIRLYPAYIFAVILTFSIVSLYSLERLQTPLPDAILNLTMFQGFMPGVDVVDGVYWSLRVELTFYIIVGFLLFFKLERKVMLFSVGWLVVSTLIQVTHSIFDNRLLMLIESFSISNYSHLFIIGIMFFMLKDNSELKYHLVIALSIGYDFIFLGLESALFTTFFVSLFYLIINGKLKFLNSRILVFFGAISYTLYLVHQNIGYVIIHFMESIGLTHELFIIIPILISILIAYAIMQLIEKPIQNKLLTAYKVRGESKTLTIIEKETIAK